MKEKIPTYLNLPEKENILDDQVRWEYLKYKVRKFFIKFSKTQAKKLRKHMNNHEEYNDCKTQSKFTQLLNQ